MHLTCMYDDNGSGRVEQLYVRTTQTLFEGCSEIQLLSACTIIRSSRLKMNNGGETCNGEIDGLDRVVPKVRTT